MELEKANRSQPQFNITALYLVSVGPVKAGLFRSILHNINKEMDAQFRPYIVKNLPSNWALMPPKMSSLKTR
jgi:hypothetical protein